MNTVKITTPENIEVEYRLAGLGSRGAAAVVDSLIQTAAILVIVITIIALQINPKDLFDEHGGWFVGGVIILVWLITYGYFIIFEMTMNGMTPGKKLLGIRTLRNNGEPITIKHSIIRNLFRIIVDAYGVGVVLIFFSKQHKRVGDYVGSTMVVVVEKKDIPIVLGINEIREQNYKYSITKEEHRLLKEYYQRKSSLDENIIELEKELGKYFAEKLEIEKNEGEYDRFLKELLEQGVRL
ncbi:RDD family protein [Wukongibacter baidiensis]|uniref:RDD family protein n=1 Tax=Wukongibacter baidiensis TaxID=1723361 RepID=UPI003D7F23C0